MRIVIDDAVSGIVVVVHASGGYAPDVMDDLRNRAVDSHRDALINRGCIRQEFGQPPQEGTEGTDK
jgi:hypothetical protein